MFSPQMPLALSRRRFMLGLGAAASVGALASYASEKPEPVVLSGTEFDLQVIYQTVNFTGKKRLAVTVNGIYPAPTLRWREGDEIKIRVTNHLQEETSIHWHGIILPAEMDGVPGLSFDGIKSGETFEYKFKVQQSGTYWYHSHSNFQEGMGLAGAIIIDPREPAPFQYDRDMLVFLSDWNDQLPEHIYARLKKSSDYYNYHQRTLGDTLSDIKAKGLSQTWQERSMWNLMRMSDRDIADVTGYTYLINGHTPTDFWMGLFKPGEKIRLRLINAAAMTIFDVRIPGLKMTVVAADGQNVQPVTVDEIRMGTAEVYDLIIEPGAQAYCLFAQTIDRSGFARASLSPDPSLVAPVPALEPPPVLGHQDMGMGGHSQHVHTQANQPEGANHVHQTAGSIEQNHSEHNHQANTDHSQHDMSQMDHDRQAMSHDMGGMEPDMSGMDHNQHDMAGMDHSQHQMSGMAMNQGDTAPVRKGDLLKAGFGNSDADQPIIHPASETGPGVDMRSQMPASGLADPGVGLRDHQEKYGRRVLTYADLRNLYPTYDTRQPSREIQLHLTGNMHRYIWSINGQTFMDAAPLELKYGERVRLVLVNDTMMTHPIHLHGMWSELETGDPDHIPRKHTIIVQPGSRISYLVTANARGRWAYHCHLMFHMPGMMREVKVS